MPAQDKLTEDMSAQGELVEVKPEADKPALSILVESMPAQGELVEYKPALSMLVGSMPAQDKLTEDMSTQGELVEDKPALSMPDQGELVVDKLGEQHKGKLHQMEADSPAVIDYVCIIKKLEDGEGLRMGMDLLRGSVPDHGRPSISGPIQSIKMYSWAQCTVQKRLVCSEDVPCVAQEEQGFCLSTLSTYPLPIYLG
jgi:hypothetical protein